MASRVVPASSNTTTRSSPSRRLTRVDLPTFGRPITPMRTPLLPVSAGMLASRSGNGSSTTSIRVETLRPWAAAIGQGSPRPSDQKSPIAECSSNPSVLFTTSQVFFWLTRRWLAIAWSAAIRPARASTINSTISASSMAASDCSAMAASIPSSSPLIPPVSITVYTLSPSMPLPYLRSRVRPGKSATSASRERVRRLNSVDLPTLGRPTKAMTGVMELLPGFPGDHCWPGHEWCCLQ